MSYDAILLLALAFLMGFVVLDVLYRKGILWGPDPYIHGDRKPGPTPPPQWLQGGYYQAPTAHGQPQAVTPQRMGPPPAPQQGQQPPVQKPPPPKNNGGGHQGGKKKKPPQNPKPRPGGYTPF
jgi:hypothetical protein